MDFLAMPTEIMAVASTVLLFLLSSNRGVDPPHPYDVKDDNSLPLPVMSYATLESSFNVEAITRATLHSFRVCNFVALLEDDLGYWVKPRSTAWFSCFLLDQYDDDHWVKMFRMTKPAVFNLAEILKLAVEKKNTKYCLSIPILVRVACTLFKLTHEASLFICSEMFAIGRSTISLVLQKVVQAINVALQSEIAWPSGNRVFEIEASFQQLCWLPGVLGAMDGTHITISKPRESPANYFYFKPGGYSLNCQTVVDSNKRFLDLFLGMPGSTNDSRVLRRTSFVSKKNAWLFVGFCTFFPWVFSLLACRLGIPFAIVDYGTSRGFGNLPIANTLFNKKMRRGRGVVENAFGILEQTFRELLEKSDLLVTFLPDVIIYYAILHNMLLGQSHEDVERIFHVLRIEGLPNQDADEPVVLDGDDLGRDDVLQPGGADKRHQLGVFLALQRNIML